MVKVSTGNDAWDQGLGALAGGLFPDASKIAQAGLYGAQQRKATIEGDVLQQEQAGRNQVSTIFSNFNSGGGGGPAPGPGVPAVSPPSAVSPPAPTTTGTNGAVMPPPGTAGGFHPGSVQAPGGGVKQSPPAQANGSPAQLDPSVSGVLGQLIAAGTQAGYSPAQIQAGGSAMIGLMRSRGQIDDRTAAALSAQFGNAAQLQAQTELQKQGMVTGEGARQFNLTPQQGVDPATGQPIMVTNQEIARGAQPGGARVGVYNPQVYQTMSAPSWYVSTETGKPIGQFTPAQIQNLPPDQQAKMRPASAADYQPTASHAPGAGTGDAPTYAPTSELPFGGRTAANPNVHQNMNTPSWYVSTETGKPIGQFTAAQVANLPPDQQAKMRPGSPDDYKPTPMQPAGSGPGTPAINVPTSQSMGMQPHNAAVYQTMQQPAWYISNKTGKPVGMWTPAQVAGMSPEQQQQIRVMTPADNVPIPVQPPGSGPGTPGTMMPTSEAGATGQQQFNPGAYQENQKPMNFTGPGGAQTAGRGGDIPPGGIAGVRISGPDDSKPTQVITPGGIRFTTGATAAATGAIPALPDPNAVGAANSQSLTAEYQQNNPPQPVSSIIPGPGAPNQGAPVPAPAPGQVGALQAGNNPTSTGTPMSNAILAGQAGTVATPEHWAEAFKSADNLNKVVNSYFTPHGGMLEKNDPVKLTGPQQTYITQRAIELARGRPDFQTHPDLAQRAAIKEAVDNGWLQPPDRSYHLTTPTTQEVVRGPGGKETRFLNPIGSPPGTPQTPAPFQMPGGTVVPSANAAPAQPGPAVFQNTGGHPPGQRLVSQSTGAIYEAGNDGTLHLVTPGRPEAPQGGGLVTAPPATTAPAPAPAVPDQSMSSIIIPQSERRAATPAPAPPSVPFSERRASNEPPPPPNPNTPNARLKKFYGGVFGGAR